MDFWEKAKVFAGEAAKKSQEISSEAAKKSQEFTKGAAKLQDFVKKSKEFAVEASKKADQIKSEAMRRADQIKNMAGEIPVTFQPLVQGLPLPSAESDPPSSDLERFGITEELRDFVKGITLSTFRDFPMEDEPEMSEVPTVSNVRQDLNEWQARHATLVLSAVKEISKLRYELCPRYMKERKFWQIYFILVDSHVTPYEKQFMDGSKEARREEESKSKSTVLENSQPLPAPVEGGAPPKTKASSDHDLDVFLLGDGSSDEGPDDGADMLDDDDLDKIEDNLE